MANGSPEVFSAPWLLGTAFLLIGVAILQKALNLFGTAIPLIDVYPSRVLEWAVTLMILEIALTLRQILDRSLRHSAGSPQA